MANYHFDTSALVKYYVREPGSTWIRSLIDAMDVQNGQPIHTVSIAEMCITETAAAFGVLHRTGRVRQAAWTGAFNRLMADVTQRWLVVDTIRQDFVTAAFLTRNHPLRAYDAVQLAVAVRYRAVLDTRNLSLVVVSGDRTMLTAATAEGLLTDNPFDHVSPLDTAPAPRP